MKKISIYCFICLFIPSLCFAGKKENLLTKLDVFRTDFQRISYARASTAQSVAQGIDNNNDEMMSLVSQVAANLGITDDLISVIPEVVSDFQSQNDIVSLWLLAAMTYHIIPLERRSELQGIMLMFFMSMVLAINNASNQDNFLQQVAHNLTTFLPESDFSNYMTHVQTFLLSLTQQTNIPTSNATVSLLNTVTISSAVLSLTKNSQ